MTLPPEWRTGAMFALLLAAIAGTGIGETNGLAGSSAAAMVTVTGKCTEARGQIQAYQEAGFRRVFLTVYRNGKPTDFQQEIICPEKLALHTVTNRLIVVTGEIWSAKRAVKGFSGQAYVESRLYAAGWKPLGGGKALKDVGALAP